MVELVEGAIDTAIILGDAGKCKAMESVALWSDLLVVALPEDHPLAAKPVIYWPELKRERFIITHHDPGPDIRVVLLRHLAGPSDRPEIVTRRLSRESLLSEVADGQGIALQCESAVGLSCLGVVFRPRHNGNGATRLGYVACWKPDNTNPALKTFLDTVKSGRQAKPWAHFERLPPSFLRAWRSVQPVPREASLRLHTRSRPRPDQAELQRETIFIFRHTEKHNNRFGDNEAGIRCQSFGRESPGRLVRCEP